MFRKRIRRTKEVQAELNITAFMNLMVVLVPFLLITAVFSQVTILKLNLPGGVPDPELIDEDPPMQLEVIIRKNRLVLAEQNSGVISEFVLTGFELEVGESAVASDIVDVSPGLNSNEAFTVTNELEETLSPFDALNLKLQQLKARAPEATTIRILAEPETPYDLIIQTMDAVRLIDPDKRIKTEVINGADPSGSGQVSSDSSNIRSAKNETLSNEGLPGELFPDVSIGSAPPDPSLLDETSGYETGSKLKTQTETGTGGDK